MVKNTKIMGGGYPDLSGETIRHYVSTLLAWRGELQDRRLQEVAQPGLEF